MAAFRRSAQGLVSVQSIQETLCGAGLIAWGEAAAKTYTIECMLYTFRRRDTSRGCIHRVRGRALARFGHHTETKTVCLEL
jgi:hypothetical protein